MLQADKKTLQEEIWSLKQLLDASESVKHYQEVCRELSDFKAKYFELLDEKSELEQRIREGMWSSE